MDSDTRHLTPDTLRRYARNIMLPEIGEAGQRKLLDAKILVVGAGGLGSALLSYLAAAGVGHIGIVDGDRVELSNLQRQILHEQSDIGRLKVESARDRIGELNPDVRVTVYPFDLAIPHPGHLPKGEGAENSSPLGRGWRVAPGEGNEAEHILSAYDLVADGCDNFATRFLAADLCEKLRRPLVSAAISGFKGQLSTFKPYLGAPHPRYRDLVPGLPPEAQTCTETGVVGAVCGILGAMQALEVIKEILGIGESLSGTLVRYDGLKQEFVRSKLRRGAE